MATNDSGEATTSAAVNITVRSAVATVYYIETDHLNTPRLIANSTGTTVWRWDQGEPFGNDVPNNNPSGAGAFDFNLRFPGQYFDRETNLAYNMARDYDSSIGRYVESDPIGLDGDLNTFSYVNGNPTKSVDPMGLFLQGPGAEIGATIGTAVEPGGGTIAGAIIGGVIGGVITGAVVSQVGNPGSSAANDPSCKPDDPCERWRKILLRRYMQLLLEELPNVESTMQHLVWIRAARAYNKTAERFNAICHPSVPYLPVSPHLVDIPGGPPPDYSDFYSR